MKNGFGKLLIVVLFVCVIGVQACSSMREPWVGFDFIRNPGASPQGQKLTCHLKEVDDIGDIWVLNSATFKSGYFSPALRAKWRNINGNAKGDLTGRLGMGSNYVVFTLFNRVYSGPSVLKTGGKYQAEISIYLDNSLVYSKELYGDYNKRSLIFASAMKVEVHPGGMIRIGELNQEEELRLMDVVRTGIAPVLHETAGDAHIDWPATVVKIILNDPEARQAFDELDRLQRELQ